MPIVSHTLDDSVQADGTHTVVVHLVDQDGVQHIQSFHAPAGADIAAQALAVRAAFDDYLAAAEFATLTGA